MLRSILAFVALVFAFALGAWIGWWMVPAIAALWGALRPSVWYPMRAAATAATLGWAFWLGVDFLRDQGAFLRLGQGLAATLNVPLALLLLLTLVVPAILAWSASGIACRIAGFLASTSGDSR